MNPKDAALASISQKLADLQNEFDSFLGQQAQSNEVEYNGDDTMDMVQPAPGVETANTMVSTTNQPASCAGCYEADAMETTTLEDDADMDTDDTAPIAPENTEEVPPMADDTGSVDGDTDMEAGMDADDTGSVDGDTDMEAGMDADDTGSVDGDVGMAAPSMASDATPTTPMNTKKAPPVEEDEDMDQDDVAPESTEEPAMPEDDDSSADVASDVDADVTPDASTDVDADVDATPEADVEDEATPDISAISTEELQAELDRRESESTDDSVEGTGPEGTPEHDAGETAGHEAAETDEKEAAEQKSSDPELEEEGYDY